LPLSVGVSHPLEQLGIKLTVLAAAEGVGDHSLHLSIQPEISGGRVEPFRNENSRGESVDVRRRLLLERNLSVGRIEAPLFRRRTASLLRVD
jgi:hypothetical protein